MAEIEIIEQDMYRMVKIQLENESFRIESGAMYYYKGELEMEAKAPSLGGFLKSVVSSESIVKPVYTGTGELYLEPSFSDYHTLELSGEEWILDSGAYICSEMGVEVEAFKNKALAGIFSGEGIFQTRVSGNGKVVIESRGPVVEIELNEEKLVVDGRFAIAREASVEFEVEKSSKKLFGTMLGGEGLVNTFRGTGKVLLAPLPNAYSTFAGNFKEIKRSSDSILSKIGSLRQAGD